MRATTRSLESVDSTQVDVDTAETTSTLELFTMTGPIHRGPGLTSWAEVAKTHVIYRHELHF